MIRFTFPSQYEQTGSTLALSRTTSVKSRETRVIAITGFRIPWLTDVLSNPAYGSDGWAAALPRFLSNWQQQVHTLALAQNSAFSLRLFWKPTSGAVEVYGLARVVAFEQNFLADATHASQLLTTIARNYEWPTEKLTESQLHAVCNPSWARVGVEVRQGETIYQAQAGPDRVGIYSILPFAQPRGDWRDLLVALMAHAEPVMINLHLQPTFLRSEEKEALSFTARSAAQLINIDIRHGSQHIRRRNPEAETASRIYNTLSTRLERPFLAAAHIFAQSERVAESLATRLGAVVVGKDLHEIEKQAEEIPSGYGASFIQDKRNAEAVVSSLWFAPCSNHQLPVPPGKERLRYLVDSRGGAAIFRLPVPGETGLPGIEVRKRQGGHEVGRRTTILPTNHLLLGTQANGHVVSIHVKDLTRHSLICGIQGSGKTNTSLNLLAQLWRDYKVPFWVFEPPKNEYRGLLQQPGFEDLLVFTVGDESTAPLRLNPFELPPEIPLERHVMNLKSCFEVGLPKIDDSGQLLGMFVENAIRDAYRANGWRFRDTAECGKEPPTLHSLLPQITKALQAYTGENKTNLEAAIGNRVRSLLRGSKGRMFNVVKGVPVEHLMRRPVVFELLPMGADAPLALMFLLTTLREFASERQKSSAVGVEHVTMIEEAHVIMSRGDGERSGPSAGVASAFENILAELRSSGEGVIIAEQSPTKLIRGAIALTSLKVVHRLSDNKEVEAVGGAMAATSEQGKSLQLLEVGQAGFFMQGSQGVSFFQAPNYMGDNQYSERLPTSQVRKAMAAYYDAHPWLRLPFQGCWLCRSICQYRNDIEGVLDSGTRRRIDSAWLAWTDAKSEEKIRKEAAFYKVLASVAAQARHRGVLDAAWCSWVQTVDEIDEDYIFSRVTRQAFDLGFLQASEDDL